MRILSRYILKEVASHSLLGLLIFTFLLYFPSLNRLLEIVVRRNMPPSNLLVLFLLPIPGVLVVTIPIATLLGVLIGLSRMAADGEVIAARAGGVNLGQFARPVILYGLLGCTIAWTMSLVLAPEAAWKLMRMENELKATQLPYEVNPRIFINKFPKLLLYLKDVTASGALWKGVFLANTANARNPEITLAQTGYLASDANGRGYTLHLEHGTTYKVEPQNPLAFSVISFNNTDINIPIDRDYSATPRVKPAPTQTLAQLIRYIQNPRYRHDGLVEVNYRLALPMAALTLAWIGLPLGLFTRKGGKALGVMLAILLVFVYYVIMALGRELALQGRVSPEVGLWAANAVFAIAGSAMMLRMRRVRARPIWMQHVDRMASRLVRRWRVMRRRKAKITPQGALLKPRKIASRFLQILDVYVVGQWLFYALITEITLTGIYLIFDFFQLLNDIVRNHATAGMVLSYYGYSLPNVTYLVLPLSVLVATLVSLSLLTKTSQTIAMRSAGISLYRIALPIALGAVVASGLMFAANDRYLPAANQREEALRNEIQGRPAQTFFRSGWQWMFGRSNRIYNYRFFDPDHNVFADISVFDFDSSFHLTRRIYAQRAFWEPHVRQWIFENGWMRQFSGDRVTMYRPFSVAGFRKLREQPSYFETEVRTSEQMGILELRHYIQELRQSGFDVVRLTVEFYRKFSYPLVALVVVLIGIPFGFTVGRKGALSGIALSLGIAVAFWSISSLFQAMGNLNQLPPAIAAWTPDVLFGIGGSYLLLRVRT
jgi:LPS export ABC transporter permease LptG/LPS export ABC transporter permease LptF